MICYRSWTVNIYLWWIFLVFSSVKAIWICKWNSQDGGQRRFSRSRCRADSRLAPSRWETSLQSNAVSHWLRENLQLALQICICLSPSLQQAQLWWQNWTRHDDVIKWKHFPRYWPFVRGIHRSPVNSPRKGQWRGALMFNLICTQIKGWVNNREAGDLRRNRAHYDVTVMVWFFFPKSMWLLTLWPQGDATVILNVWSPNIYYVLSSWAPFVKFPSRECHSTPRW